MCTSTSQRYSENNFVAITIIFIIVVANGSKLHHGPSPYLSLGLGTIKSRKPTSKNNYDNKNNYACF